MPSVIVSWSGRCDDHERRAHLSAIRLYALAEQSHNYFENPPPIEFGGGTHEGRIVVERAVFAPDQDLAGFASVQEAKPSGPFTLSNPLASEPLTSDDDLLVVPKVELHGFEFRLYDGRCLYDDDRVSFVFALFDDREDLGWRLVKVEHREQCRSSPVAAIQSADLFLSRPSVHLRGYCEEWMDWLLAAVKIFHVPDLVYWRHEPMANFAEISAQIAALDPDGAEGTVWAYLERRLEQEVEGWRERASDAKSFWTAMREAAAKPPDGGAD